MKRFTTIICLFCFIQPGFSQPNWHYTITGISHSVVIQQSAPTINGTPVSSGDYIGAFYDSLGILACAGYGMWDNQNMAVTVWGDDSQTTNPDGFTIGEEFTWKIWQASGEQEFIAAATYVMPVGITDTSLFAVNGTSNISVLEVTTSIEQQNISLAAGWGIFSTYMVPNQPNIDSICSAYISQIIIVKDGFGNIYWPQYLINTVGNLTLGLGYQIKTTTSFTLPVNGSIADPQSTPLYIPQGWSIIGYLRSDAAPIIQMLSPVVNNVSIVKDGNGDIYWPQYLVNMIGDMEPGQGYQIKMIQGDTLYYDYSSNQLPFLCGDSIIDYDGNAYGTTLIGGQCWMDENLRTSHTAAGQAIPYVETGWGTLTNTDPAFSYYSNNTSNAEIYGYLYTWAAVMNGAASSSAIPSGVQGPCPQSWHIPSDEEWKMLEGRVDSMYNYPDPEWDGTNWRGYDAGKNLKTISGWNSGGNGTDLFGYAALPGGYRHYSGGFFKKGDQGYFWTSTEASNDDAWYHTLYRSYDKVKRYDSPKNRGFSVRCIWDTIILPATVITDTITNITDSSAIFIGTVISNGGAPVLDKGFCWNTSGNPSLADSSISLGSGTGTYSFNVVNLLPNTIYYVRTYVTNSVETSYGEELSFSTIVNFVCGDPVIDYDGNVYGTILIGGQCWMSENLKTSHTAAGQAIPLVETGWGTLTNTDPAYSYYSNNTSNAETYGYLYTWAAVMNGAASSSAIPSGVQGPCPQSWHVPSDEEWKMLEGTVDSLYDYPDPEWDGTNWRGYDTGKNLKTISGWDNNGNGTDAYGFSALPGGFRSTSGIFTELGDEAFFWTSTETSTDNAWYRQLIKNYNNIKRYDHEKKFGYSVRCVWDNVITPATVTTDSVTNVTNTSANFIGTIVSNGGAPILDKGFCWNTSGNPSLADSSISLGVGSGTGTYSTNVANLLPNTIYYVRAYVTNSLETSFGDVIPFSTVINFTCGNPLLDVDGNAYGTTLIGGQCWMNENLRTTHTASGQAIPLVETGWGSLTNTDPAYSYYGNNTSNAETYGYIYNWAAVMNGAAGSSAIPSGVQGPCPQSWHVPSDEEWKMLEGTVDSLYDYPDPEWDGTNWRGYDAGQNLKTTSGWNSNGNGSDMYGFSALPGGYRTTTGIFTEIGDEAFFWTSTQFSNDNAWYRQLIKNYNNIKRYNKQKEFGFSVRCVWDTVILPPSVATITVTNISSTSAKFIGAVVSDGGTPIIDKGFCWNTSGNPCLADTSISVGSGLGVFNTTVSNLLPNTTFYVRAYATNSLETSYGDEVQFTTSLTFACGDQVSDIDGNVYNTVLIGGQCWMKENLRTTTYPDSTSIPEITSDTTYTVSTDAFFSYFQYDSTMPVHYSWNAIMFGASSSNAVPSGVQGICPTGWHIPSDEEWKILEGKADSGYNYPDPEWDGISWRGNNCGSNLKSTYGWNSNGNGTDLLGFKALPEGVRESNYGYGSSSLGESTYFWTSTESTTNVVWNRYIYSFYDYIGRNSYLSPNYGMSVRCVYDSLNNSPTVTTSSLLFIDSTSVQLTGNVVSDGGQNILTKGFCWNITGNPTLSDTSIIIGNSQNPFSGTITDLLPVTTYFIRAFAINSVGTSYSNEYVISTPNVILCGDQISDYEGNVYNTIYIGSQCWMKENLRTTYFPNGTPIPHLSGDTIVTLVSDSFYSHLYNDTTMPVHYSWSAMMNGAPGSNLAPSGVQGICPTGWHIPSDKEWKILEGKADSYYNILDPIWNGTGFRGTDCGYNLKADYDWMNNGNGFDAFGFTALPDDSRDPVFGYSYSGYGFSSYFWTATSASPFTSWYRKLEYDDDETYRNSTGKNYGFSVRCVKD